jgi:hypothetical protein
MSLRRFFESRSIQTASLIAATVIGAGGLGGGLILAAKGDLSGTGILPSLIMLGLGCFGLYCVMKGTHPHGKRGS